MTAPTTSEMIVRLAGSKRIAKLGIAMPVDVIKMDKGDPDFETPEPIAQALTAAVREGYTHYPPPAGDPNLREAIADFLARSTEADFTADDIFITNGAAGAIFAAMAAYLDPGDEVLLHDPVYSLYADVANGIGAVPVAVSWGPGFRLDVTALEASITNRTRMLVLNNPCNPTGSVLSQSEMDRVAAFVRHHDLILVADEAYDHIVFGGSKMVSAGSLPSIADRTIIVNTCSKTFAMTGWRIGYLAGRAGLTRAPSVIHRTAVGGVNYPAQRAAIVAFRDCDPFVRRMVDEYQRRGQALCALLGNVPHLDFVQPAGTFYVFAKVELPQASEEVAARLLENGLAIRSGTEFGANGEGYLRFTFAVDPALYPEAVNRLTKTVTEFAR